MYQAGLICRGIFSTNKTSTSASQRQRRAGDRNRNN
ncbi:hypothetical protein MAR_005505 [Mya arenaria]|uniref:Uncharacterized protein n=1 Tax=Mya arenaria TaxID=6604 RepID=A0ABY7F178_MYAAR|nr:hypothetical protein MAR_005505 [Mya arenaria]